MKATSRWLTWEPTAPILRDSPGVEPTKTTETTDPDLAAGEAALAFCNHAGARLVAACPTCHPGLPAEARYAVLVPAVNHTPEFRQALAVLRLAHLAVLVRGDPLAHLPALCQHQKARR